MVRSEGEDGEEWGLTHRLPFSTERLSLLAHNISHGTILDICSTWFHLDYLCSRRKLYFIMALVGWTVGCCLFFLPAMDAPRGDDRGSR